MRLEVKDLRKSFGEKEVLHGISFEVESGKALGLLGRNGAGKTTTIRILMDVFHANAGTITMDGKPFVPRDYQIGYLPEERGLYPKKEIATQIIYLARLRGMSPKEASTNMDYWLKRLGVEEYRNKKLDTLSKGNQQKVQLVQTLVCNPEIVILDEPFSGLDPVNSQVLKDVIRELIQSGRIVIFSSHQMSYVEEFCEDIVIINHGEVVLSGDLKVIKRQYGKNRLLLSAENQSSDWLVEKLQGDFSSMLEVVSVKPEGVVAELLGGATKKMVLQQLVEQDMEVEFFGNYQPSLTDIFVERAGDQK